MPSKRSKRSNPPSLLQFQQQFPNEEACFKYLYQIRRPNGWTCPECQAKEYYYIKERKIDESFFGATKEGGSRGRGTGKTKVLVGLSLNHLGYPCYLRFKVLPRINRNTLDPVIEKLIIPGAMVKTDGLRCYLSLPQKGYQHERILANQTDILESMRRLHTAVSNAKALIDGTFHGLDSKHLQSYLDEIGYRFNRRHMLDRIFERCVVAMVECSTWTYWDIVAKAPKPNKSRLKAA